MVPRSGRAGLNRLSGIHRFLIQSHFSSSGALLFKRSVTCTSSCSFAAARMAPNTAIRIGQVSSMGRQLDRGLTCSFLYSSAIFWFSFSLSLAYFFCSACIWGCSLDVFRMLTRLLMSRGVSTRRIRMVNTTMAQP